jgi:MFS family permease
MSSNTGGGQSRSLILTAMIFAVAMTFIDQTIVSIAAPTIQHDLGLSSSGMQWAINAYLLTLAAFFAFGGRLADTQGHRKMVVLGVIIFAGASALCGATPRGSAARRGWWRSARCRASAGRSCSRPPSPSWW